ncbi:MAG: DUF4886 domain-containing protein [Bacilli bacterium]|nr:DUF4886 domain-containing protein [Bacilli bacterium]
MNKAKAILPLTLLAIVMSGCGQGTSSSSEKSVPSTPSISSEEPVSKKLKVLTIGNSFGEDTIKYVPSICEGLGVEYTVAHMFIGGCSMALHKQNCDTDAATYRYYKNWGEGWMEKQNVAISTAIAEEDWDYVLFNGLSGETDVEGGYNDYLLKYVGVRSKNPNVKLGFNFTFSYNQDNPPTLEFNEWFFNYYKRYDFNSVKMYNAGSTAMKNYLDTSKLCDFILPVATSVQNAKTIFTENEIHRDYIHMSHFLGRYICGLTFVYYFTGLTGTTFYPSYVSKEEADIAETCVKAALENPWTITTIEGK